MLKIDGFNMLIQLRLYRSVIHDPMTAYFGSKCDIPKWLMNDQNVFDEI